MVKASAAVADSQRTLHRDLPLAIGIVVVEVSGCCANFAIDSLVVDN